MASTGSAGGSLSGSGLSAEQLKKIEENRHRAREKLASRKQQEPSITFQQTVNPSKSSAREQHFISTSLSHAPINHKATIPSKESGRSSIGSFYPKYPNDHHTSTTTTSLHTCTQQVSGHISTTKYTELVRQSIKANLLLVSRERFEIVVPYDKSAIGVFKKTPSNSYNAKTAHWSFGMEVYDRLVASLQSECQHIELNQIPRPVVSLFQSLPSARPHSNTRSEGGWNGVGTKLSSTLMQFQKEGVDYCIRHGGRALLADDMGLGKTLQALAVMSHYRTNWPLLVICPSSVKLTWAEACHHWVSSLGEDDVSVILTGKLSSTSSPITIISYDLATRLGAELAQRRPDAIIVDESHFLKNFKTNRCKAILPLVKSATRCLLLSGTPALSRPIELYTQISALDKSFKMTRVNFGIRYCSAVKNHFGWDFSGASNLNELLLYMQEKFMIRRLKNDVLDQLPSKRRQTVLLDPSITKTQSREVRELRKELEKAGMLKAMDRRSALLPLFEKTGRLKLPAVRDYILDLLEGGRKLIVFGHHRSVLDSISESLDAKGYQYIRIDGRTPVESRQLLCDRFQHDDSCLVAVLSITTANAGLTLTASSTVVFAELFWNPGILVQAEDRAYRIGQKNCVNVHYLVARETVDDFIWPLIQNKLTVLNKAGLAVDDFSSTESTVMKNSEPQQDLYEFFAESCSQLDAEESDMTVDMESREDSDNAEVSRKNMKRKRVTIESFADDDADFGTRTQKQKHSHKKVCSAASPGKKKNIGKQRTLTSMCSESISEAGNKEKTRGDDAKQSKASDLAIYLLSQYSTGSSNTTSSLCETVKPVSKSTVIKPTDKNTHTCIMDSTYTGSTSGAIEDDLNGHRKAGTSHGSFPADSCSTHDAAQPVAHRPSNSGTMCIGNAETEDLLPPSGMGTRCSSVSGCDGKWLDGLEDCDLASFDNFDDDEDGT